MATPSTPPSTDVDAILAKMPGAEMAEPTEALVDEPAEPGLDAAAEELIAAVQSGDAAGVKAAFRAAFDILRSE